MASSAASHLHLCALALRRRQRHTGPDSLLFSAAPPSLPHRSPLAAPHRSSSICVRRIRVQHRQQQEQGGQPPREVPAADPTPLPPRLREIISLFQSVSDPKAKYQQLLHYGSKLPPLDPRFKTEEHRVRGCVSQVWVRAFPDPAGPAAAVRFEADSDSALTKGLAALLVLGLSGAPALDIARVSPEFVHLLGLRQSLTPSRNNGFLNMLKLMQQKALELHARGGNSTTDGVSSRKDSTLVEGPDSDAMSATADVLDGKDGNLLVNGNGDDGHSVIDGDDRAHEADSGVVYQVPSSSGGRASRIREILGRELQPTVLEVQDISNQHAGHAAVRRSGDGETHFNLRIVSKEFEGKSLVKRHRLVYDLLKEELQSGLHALSIVAKTPVEVSVN